MRQTRITETRTEAPQDVMSPLPFVPSHFGSSHFPFERALCFSCSTSVSGFCLVQVSTTQFCSFSFLMARVSDGTNVPISPAPASSSNMGFPDGSLPDLEGPGFRPCTMEEKINEIYLQLPLFLQNAARIENCVQTLAQTVAAQSTKDTNIEQIVGIPMARVTSWEQNAAVPVAQIQQDLGTCLDQVTAPQPLGHPGPMAQGLLMTVEVQGVDLILSQALKMNMHGVPSYYGSHVNSTTLELRSGSILFGKLQTYQPTINLSQLLQGRFRVGQTKF